MSTNYRKIMSYASLPRNLNLIKEQVNLVHHKLFSDGQHSNILNSLSVLIVCISLMKIDRFVLHIPKQILYELKIDQAVS